MDYLIYWFVDWSRRDGKTGSVRWKTEKYWNKQKRQICVRERLDQVPWPSLIWCLVHSQVDVWNMANSDWPLPNIYFWYLENAQLGLAKFWTSNIDVWNMTSIMAIIYWSCSGHRTMMSKIRPWIRPSNLALFRISLSFFWTSLGLFRTSF